ncbi:M23 family metallopeptidase [Desulforhabdus sp. TSK]|uniref:M23 family metallopeptidase n=1 Tax=Desulforhabdus sp. TSK TaxID=2925014 RepID=UPI001FC80D06|nr:M23 family metallopeptidase [Desulforhabdus sp. TSK]GKT10679.1 peptidase M23 [Desulforhabdus sp. TSK]
MKDFYAFDSKHRSLSALSKPRKWKLGRWVCLALLVVLGGLALQHFAFSPRAHIPESVPAKPPELDYPDRFALRSQYLSQFTIRHHVVQPGDTLHEVMARFDLPMECLEAWQKACAGFCSLDQIQPDDELTVRVNSKDGQPVKFTYASQDGATYIFRKPGETWECRRDDTVPSTLVHSVRGTITDTLFDSCLRSGLPANLIMDLANLFAYDIDFTTDLREGDTFAVHFEDTVKDGRRLHSGPILAAEMVVGGHPYQAFAYTSGDHMDYFDAVGESLRKAFLKTPLSYSRISSLFDRNRMHPVLKIRRPHLGVDYAAPVGTPVSALGTGVITFLGNKGGFGRYMEVRHKGPYKTGYGHLSAFAEGLRKGSKVAQGDVIGYVGESGMATGPHLDFRFYKDGKPIDFLQMDFPKAKSIPKGLIADFMEKRDAYLAALQDRSLAISKNAALPPP